MNNNRETMELIENGEDLMFTFAEDARRFAYAHSLILEYDDGGLTDDPHYNIEGYKSKIYCVAW